MRKFFTLFVTLAVATVLYAAQVRQNVWGGTLALTNDEFQPHHESLFATGQTLRLTFDNNSGWMQVFHKDGANGWTSTDLISGLDLSSGVVEISLSSTAVNQIKNFGGLYVKGGDITLKSIDLIYDDGVAPEMHSTTIWTGSLTAGHEQESIETNIDAANFANVKVGDKIRFSFSENDGEGYFQMSAITKNSDWNTSHSYMSYTGVNAPTAEFSVVAEGLDDLKARGLYFKGKHITITKAELLQPEWVAESTWTGSITSSETPIAASYFSSAVAGNKLRFHFSNNIEDSYYQLTAVVKDADWHYHHYMNYDAVVAPTHDIELEDGDNLDNLKARGLFVLGTNITITKIELLREKVSTDDKVVAVLDDADPTVSLQDMFGETVDFTINRTLYCDGYYNTLCLPFNLASLDGTPLEDATVMEYAGAEISGTGSDLTLDVTIEPVTSIEAGKPYLVSFPSGSDITSMTFRGVTISTTTPQTIESAGLNMVGILAPTPLDDAENMLFLGANNTLYWSDNSNPLKGFRAYFEISGGSSAPIRHGMAARIVQKTDVTTAAETVTRNADVQKHIINGQLIIIRDGIQYNALGQTISK